MQHPFAQHAPHSEITQRSVNSYQERPHRLGFFLFAWLVFSAGALLGLGAWRGGIGGVFQSFGWATSLLALSLGFGAALFSWRVVLAVRYRAEASVADKYLPHITVVVPAYNEGAQVSLTLESLLKSDYPAHKLRIIAVDDGSQDDTWSFMERSAASSKGRVEAVRCAQNRGKRHALYEGIVRARGTVIVTVDSDSEVDENTLRNLVTPFVTSSDVGAVAGNVRVLARQEHPLARMLDVSFTYGFDFMRASQSEVGSVICTPGALSAYRADLVNQVLCEWMGQTFLGRRANIGEDRAMTNLILRAGKRVVFQRNAVVHTMAPTKFVSLCKMFLRWARSNVRETLLMNTFVWRRAREEGLSGLTLNYIQQISRLLFTVLFFLPGVYALVAYPQLVIPMGLFGSFIGACVPAFVYGKIRGNWAGALWAFGYSGLSWAGLSWIGPYALVTPRQTGWLTRQLPSAPQAAASAKGAPRSEPLAHGGGSAAAALSVVRRAPEPSVHPVS